MYLVERYRFFYLAYDLINNNQFNMLHIDEKNNEVWLDKKVNGTTHLIRIAHKGFDWKNHLQQDIQLTINKAQKIKQLVIGRNVHVHNVYIATYAPVDDWESVRESREIKDGKLKHMSIYYLDDSNEQNEKEYLYKRLSLDVTSHDYPQTEVELEYGIHHLQAKVVQSFQQMKKQSESMFQNGKPNFSYILLALNILMFIVLEWKGGSTTSTTLITYGAKYNPAILDGEWWRIISSMFLHIGSLHLIMNMLALFYVGTAVEKIYGTSRFVIIYFLAGIIGGLTSFALNPHIAAGASGALFGLFGALLFFGLNYQRIFFQTMGWNVITVIGINIVFGFSVPQIDNGAHIGGLIGGFIASAVVFFPTKRRPFIQLLSLFVYLGLVVSIMFYGVNNTAVQMDPTLQIQIIQDYVKEEEFEAVVETTSNVLNNNPETEFIAELLFFRSYALIKLDDTNKALNDLEQVIEVKPDFPEAQYNLALLYEETERIEEALKAAETAHELSPGNQEFYDLYQRLSKE